LSCIVSSKKSCSNYLPESDKTKLFVKGKTFRLLKFSVWKCQLSELKLQKSLERLNAYIKGKKHMKSHLIFLLIFIVSIVLVWPAAAVPAPQPDQLIYSTYLGGELADEGNAIALDAIGNVYVTGFTSSILFPALSGRQTTLHGIDVYVAKLSPDGRDLEYLFWFDAAELEAEDYAYSIAVDSEGSAYVTGQTYSPDFCSLFGDVPGYNQNYNGGGDAFLFKVKADGSGLDYCTFLGGSEWDIGRAVTVDETGSAYVTGGTWSDDFEVTPGAFDTLHNGLRDVFVAKLDPTGTQVDYATYLGGALQEESRAIALDSDNNVYITGWTNSNDFYTTPDAFDPHHNGGFDAFVVKLNAAGNDVVYATYLGGPEEDRGMGIAIDTAAYTYVTGYTTSTTFPTTAAAYDQEHNGDYDVFVVKLNTAGTNLSYATFLGGGGNDRGHGIALDHTGSAYITGETQSTYFPTTADAFSGQLNSEQDAFLVRLNSSGDQLVYGSFLGGSNWDRGLGVATDGTGYVYLTGATLSPDFPTTSLAYDESANGDYDVFITMLDIGMPEESAYRLYLPAIGR
jgi:hypothetical protein